jgi:hypothetical protein
LLSVTKVLPHAKLKLQYLDPKDVVFYRAAQRTLILFEVPREDIHKCPLCNELHVNLYPPGPLSDVVLSQTTLRHTLTFLFGKVQATINGAAKPGRPRQRDNVNEIGFIGSWGPE